MYEEDYGDEQAAAEEAAYQEMCDAGAFEQQQMESEAAAAEAERLKEMEEALEHGIINKNPDLKVTSNERLHSIQ